MRTLLTIDWDFFVPIDAMLDLAHDEAKFFITDAWILRMHLLNSITTSGHEQDFWAWVLKWANINNEARLFVSESHSCAYAIAEAHAIDQVISIDTHHDCWPNYSNGYPCAENWLRKWLSQKERRALWVRPKEETDFALPKNIAVQEKMYNPDEPLCIEHEIVSIHICRSGGWTPPWVDAKFINFVLQGVKNTGLKQERVKSDVLHIDVMTPRWPLHQLIEARQQKEIVNYYLTEE